MAVFPRPASTSRAGAASAARWPRLILGVLAGAAFFLFPSAAGAVVTEVAGTKVGVTPRAASYLLDGTIAGNELNEYFAFSAPESFANKSGHPVVHSSQVFLVYWDPDNLYHGDWQSVVDGFMHDVNESGSAFDDVFALDTQYTDTSNKPASGGLTFRGAEVDHAKYPASGCEDPRPLYEDEASRVKTVACLTDAQIRTELQSLIARRSFPKGMNTIYYVLTPPEVTVCLDGGTETGHCSDYAATLEEQKAEVYESESYEHSFCGYHADVNPGGLETGDANTILYGVVPWTAGGVADGQLSAADRSEAFPCQDGGFDPSSKPYAGKRETVQEWTLEEEEEYAAIKSTFGKEAFIRSREPNGPHDEQPNQAKCPSRDGFCDQGLADLITNELATQEHNIVTDPLLNSWQDGLHDEATDECRNWFAPVLGGSATVSEGSGAGTLFNQTLNEDPYYLNTAFNLAGVKLNYPAVPCMTGIRLEPKFTAPSPVNAEEAVAFDGMESDITLNEAASYNEKGEEQPNYAKYSWNFGDGTAAVTGYAPGTPPCEAPWLTPCAASVSHSYTYGGTYEVTLTVTDVSGNVASTSQMVSVVGPPAPSSGGSGGGSSTPSSSSGSSPGGSGGGSAATLHDPVIREFVLSKSLRKVLRHGLSVRFSVSEQVTGHFDVLLASSVARRLHLHGAAAAGLAAGSAPQTVIGKAILATARAGAGTITIQLGHKVLASLRRLHNVSLVVRLLVHNAQARTASAVASAKLSH